MAVKANRLPATYLMWLVSGTLKKKKICQHKSFVTANQLSEELCSKTPSRHVRLQDSVMKLVRIVASVVTCWNDKAPNILYCCCCQQKSHENSIINTELIPTTKLYVCSPNSQTCFSVTPTFICVIKLLETHWVTHLRWVARSFITKNRGHCHLFWVNPIGTVSLP